MKYRFLTSPNVYAINCDITNTQFMAEMLYLKSPLPTEDTKISLYDGDSNLAAIVIVKKTNTQEHHNVILNLCH